MTNLLQQAINCNDGDRAVKIIQDALGIESDDVANYCFPQTWPADRERRARVIGEWLRSEARGIREPTIASASRRPRRLSMIVAPFACRVQGGTNSGR
jgi:hypothetical protein